MLLFNYMALLSALEMNKSKKAEIINKAYNLVKARYLWSQRAQQLLMLMLTTNVGNELTMGKSPQKVSRTI